MALLIEFIVYLILEFLIVIPGALLRWAYFRFLGKKVKLKSYLPIEKHFFNKQYGVNALVSIGLIGFVAIVVQLV